VNIIAGGVTGNMKNMFKVADSHMKKFWNGQIVKIPWRIALESLLGMPK